VLLSGEETITIEPFRLGELVDTTGAGDLYAAGFLHGHTSGASLERCGRLGSLCAGEVVTQLGPRPQASLPDLVAQHLG
jgi:fructokinase